MTIKAAFQPRRGQNLTASSGITSLSVSLDAQAKSVRLVNNGANVCFVRIGAGAQTATTADMPVRAGSEIVVSKGDGDDTLAHISALTTTLYIQTGEGGI
jgi:hypothetical protein